MWVENTTNFGRFCYLNIPCLRINITLILYEFFKRWIHASVEELKNSCFCWICALKGTQTWLTVLCETNPKRNETKTKRSQSETKPKRNETKAKRRQVNMPVVRDVWNVRYVRLFYSGRTHHCFGYRQKSSKSTIEASGLENSINMHERGCLDLKRKTKIWKMSSYRHALYF